MPPPRICRKNGIRWVVSGDGMLPMNPGSDVIPCVDPEIAKAAALKEEEAAMKVSLKEEKKEEKQKDKLRETIAESFDKLYESLRASDYKRSDQSRQEIPSKTITFFNKRN